MYVSVTGLRLKRFWHAPLFWRHAVPSMVQAQAAEGNLFTEARMVGGVRHTLTVWRDIEAMRAYVTRGAHVRAMGAFSRIASGTIHGYHTDTMPDWETALEAWRRHGRPVGAPRPATAAS